MALGNLAKQLAIRNATPPTPPLPSPQSPPPSTVDNSAAIARELAIAKSAEKKALENATAASKQLAEIQNLRTAERTENALVSALSAPGRRAVNPAHVASLLKPAVVWHNDKLVSATDPAKGLDTVLSEFFTGNEYLLAPVVPGGGSGAPGQSTGAGMQPPPKLDLSTSHGLTTLARQVISGTVPTQAATGVQQTSAGVQK
jgi:hypothetical protein